MTIDKYREVMKLMDKMEECIKRISMLNEQLRREV